MGLHVVKSWDDSKGFGFVYTTQGDALVHWSQVQGEVRVETGDVVQADIEMTLTGLVAKHVRKTEARTGDWELHIADILGYTQARVRADMAAGAPCPVRGRTWGDLKVAMLRVLGRL